ALRNHYHDLGFKQWLNELPAAGSESTVASVVSNNVAAAADNKLTSAASGPVTAHYDTVMTQAQLNEWLNKLKAAPAFAFDTETTDLNAVRAQVVGLSFAITPGEAAYVPVAHDYPGAPDQLSRDAVLQALKPLLEDPAKLKIGQNLKYDLNVLKKYGVRMQGIGYDTMLESYVLNSVGTRHNMDDLAKQFLDYETVHFEDIAGKGAKQLTFNQIEIEKAAFYAAEDADITLRLHHAIWPQVAAEAALKKVFEEIELPLMPILAKIEYTGALVDAHKLKLQSQQLGRRMLELEKEAHHLAGEVFNLGSPKQLGEILFEKLKLPVVKKTPTGQPSTAENVLEELAVDYELPKVILEYRSLSKLKSTYTDRLPEQIEPGTGRIHTSYHQAVAATGRLSSSDPNLQNIPVRTEEGRRIRQAFIAPPGHKIMSADYSQIELRIMAHLSDDEGLLKAFA
ncbi:MAG TPA: DNA polymerase, partial [Pseudomonadales bacterium]|nr:DNA polymerase [Pseudomonadales bacterium]